MIPPGRERRGLIPVESLRVRLNLAEVAAGWVPLPELDGLAPGEIGGFDLDGVELVACRMGDDVFAYRDRCPACSQTLAGATLQRRLGGRADSLILACPALPGALRRTRGRRGAGLRPPPRAAAGAAAQRRTQRRGADGRVKGAP